MARIVMRDAMITTWLTLVRGTHDATDFDGFTFSFDGERKKIN
jgi:hypothetical protein